jgi:hypothetical protein
MKQVENQHQVEKEAAVSEAELREKRIAQEHLQ